MRPLLLPANRSPSLHRGSGRLAAFRGLPDDDRLAEEWLASTTPRSGQAPAGLTVLPDGRLLRAAIAADPFGWLGLDHLERHGPDPAMLLTLVDAGGRTPLHVHPGRDVPCRRPAPSAGGTAAWVVVEAEPDAAVQLGFRREVDAGELACWVEGQQVESMLSATNRVPVQAGDALLCPAGVPHAVGPGVLLLEFREATDLSVLLERAGPGDDGPGGGHLGLDRDAALAAVDRGRWAADRIAAELRGPAAGRPVRDGVRSLLPPAADGAFRAERVQASPRVLLDAGFAVLVILAGSGLLAWAADDDLLEVSAGDAVLVPHAAGAYRIEGPLTAIRCRPAA